MWHKLGLLFAVQPGDYPNRPWMHSHAANPVAEQVEGDVFRFYFSTRDAQNRSSIVTALIDIAPPFRVLEVGERPIISPGAAGLFDDSGASMGCLQELNGVKHLYYLGWNLGTTVPWRNSIGVATFDAEANQWNKRSLAPLIDRNDFDPYSVSYPFVLKVDGGYRMWYGSNLNWGAEQTDMAHILKTAFSPDGLSWHRNHKIAVNFEADNEYAMSRPCVIHENGVFKMWYSYRGEAYRIGYAESPDGMSWTRMDDKAGIDVSPAGWDAETVAYPFVFDHNGQRYLVYNGNRYGLTGFGLAVWQ